MAFINTSSCECGKSELDLFAVPLMQDSIENSSIVEYLPVTSIQHRASMHFDIPGSGNQYMDMANIQLYIHAKVSTGADGNTALTVDTTAAPVNLLLHSMFSKGTYRSTAH